MSPYIVVNEYRADFIPARRAGAILHWGDVEGFSLQRCVINGPAPPALLARRGILCSETRLQAVISRLDR